MPATSAGAGRVALIAWCAARRRKAGRGGVCDSSPRSGEAQVGTAGGPRTIRILLQSHDLKPWRECGAWRNSTGVSRAHGDVLALYESRSRRRNVFCLVKTVVCIRSAPPADASGAPSRARARRGTANAFAGEPRRRHPGDSGRPRPVADYLLGRGIPPPNHHLVMDIWSHTRSVSASRAGWLCVPSTTPSTSCAASSACPVREHMINGGP